MKTRMFTILLLSILMSVLLGQPMVRIDYSDFKQIRDAGFDVAYVRPGAYVNIVGWRRDMERLSSMGIPHKIVIDDLPEYYRSRMDTKLPMGGWRTFAEIVAAMDSLHNDYPAIISARDSIATGWDGNVLWMMKISDNVDTDEDEPEVLYDATIHAREVIVPEVLLYYMRWLGENYGTDPVATYLVNEREMWIMPVFNPDGYRINEIYDPGGGGMWRKNTRDNNSNSVFDGDYDGVDGNRNCGYGWGGVGASPNPPEQTYMGPDSFSEPETQGYKDFAMSRSFVSNLSYHSFGGYYLFPWGNTGDDCPDHNYYLLLSSWMSRYNKYVGGSTYDTIYAVSGCVTDWMYHALGIISFSPEVGGESDHFWPSLSRKTPLCEGQLLPNVVIGLIAGAAPRAIDLALTEQIGDSDGYPDVGEHINLEAFITNFGLQSASNVAVVARGISNGLIIVDSTASVGGAMDEKGGTGSAAGISFIINPPLKPGDYAEIILATTMPDGYELPETLSFVVGTPTIQDETTFDSGHTGWSLAGDWEAGTPTHGPNPLSAPNVLATKLNTDYSRNYSSTSDATSPTYFVSDTLYKPRLTFWHWHSIEGWDADYYDGGQVRIRILPSSTWNPIAPVTGYPYTIASDNGQLAGEQAFSASNKYWDMVLFDLSPYVGDTVQFRMALGTDFNVSWEGWYIDDWSFGGFEPETTGMTISAKGVPIPNIAISAVPNPFNSRCRISVPNSKKVALLDISGRIVRELTVKNGVAVWDGADNTGKDCSSGIYFVVPRGNGASKLKILLVR